MGKVVIVDSITGKTIEREQTADEVAASETLQNEVAARIAAIEATAAAKVSARNKLKALGLTDAEIAALVG